MAASSAMAVQSLSRLSALREVRLRSARSLGGPDKGSAQTLIAERYRIEDALGHGGAAEVYRVTELSSGRTLALKLLHSNVHPKLRELFELEYQTLASLDHPRTPLVFEFGSDARGTYYTMELLEGGDLSSLAPLPWQQVCEHLRDASQALGLLHARSLMHRDVSPRNLWRTPDGRIKLIDFGAMAPFGYINQLVGTPPFIPPEALAGQPLDQRLDLYALGGVAYYLLTGSYAFPARALNQLPDLWRAPLAPPSDRIDAAIPAQLDALVLQLLSHDPVLRPASTAEVIDRIDALIGAHVESERDAALARLKNVAFVGRERERRRLQRRLALALRGRGQACLIESAGGVGRSRVLKELELLARVSRATVLSVDAAAHTTMYGTASALAVALLDASPDRALALAVPHATLLAHLSPQVNERLGVAATAAADSAGELRVRMQEAQRDWFIAYARERPLIVLVDGLEQADDGSAAFLLALALAAPGAALFSIAALLGSSSSKRGAAVNALVRTAHCYRLGPLAPNDFQELLSSAFGDAAHLSRLSGRLYTLTRGNVGYALEICAQLIRDGVIAFESGNWVLPRELDMRTVSTSRENALADRLVRVTGQARELARALSLSQEPLSPGLCRALASCGEVDLLPHLGELIHAEILVQNGANVFFAHKQFQATCAAELAPEAELRVRRTLADYVLANPDSSSLERLRAGMHLIAIGDLRGPATVARESLQLLFHEVDKLAQAAPTIEAAFIALQQRGSSTYEHGALLTALTLGGYEGERRFVLEYGEAAVQALEEVLGLNQARRWRRYVGGKLSLGAALGLAALRFAARRSNPCVPAFRDALQMLFASVASAAGAFCICADPATAARLAEVLQPFAGLGRDYGGRFMYDYCRAIADRARDDPHATRMRWKGILIRLQILKNKGRVTDAQMRRLRGGALYAMGSLETHLDSDECLLVADQLESNGQQNDRLCADQIRMVYHGFRGDLAAYTRYRQRVELHAIARGTTWQIETWTPGSESLIALPLHDALLMKSSSEQMRRMSEAVPALRIYVSHFRGAYLLLRGRLLEAVALLSDCLREPPAFMAWARMHGVLARTFNRLGDYDSALATCNRVFAQYSPENFAHAHMNMIVQTEFAIATAGLGQVERARELLAGLRAKHAATKNALLRGQLIEAEFEIAMQLQDVADARGRLAELECLYRPLGVPSLIQHFDQLRRRVERSERGGEAPPTMKPTAYSGVSSWPNDRSNPSGQRRLDEEAEGALRVLASQTNATRGALYVVDAALSPRLAASLTDELPGAAVLDWINERITDELDAPTVAVGQPIATASSSVLWEDDACCYRMLMLRSRTGSIVGVAVLSRDNDAPSDCPMTLLQSVADKVHQALSVKL